MCKCETQKTIAGVGLDLGSGCNTEPKLPGGKIVLTANLISSWAGCLWICKKKKPPLPHPGQPGQQLQDSKAQVAPALSPHSPTGAPGLSQQWHCCSKKCPQLGFWKDAEMLALWVSSKGARGFKLEAFLPTMPGIQMCIFLNNIAHKNHLKICSESRVEGQCFPKENKKLPVHNKF